MATFESIVKQRFKKLGTGTTMIVPDLPPAHKAGCCSEYALKALGLASNTSDNLKNDKSGFLFWFPASFTLAAMTLQQYDGSAWADLTALDGSATIGDFYAFQFFVNTAGEQFIGFQLHWGLVLASGATEGSFRVKCEATNSIGANSIVYSPEYCLKTYTPERANGTFRVEYRMSGVIGDNFDDTRVRDFGQSMISLGAPGWYNAYRLPGWLFAAPKSSYNQEYVQYGNGRKEPVSNEQEPEYDLKIKNIPYFMHEILRTDVLQADEILITDYNSMNPANLVKKSVINNSSYDPRWLQLRSKLAPVDIKLIQRSNNHKKLRF